MQETKERMLDDLVAELTIAMKSGDQEALRVAQLPLIDLIADHFQIRDADIASSRHEAITHGVRLLPLGSEAAALKILLGGAGESRWSTLQDRGSRAAAELGITYDTLRKKGPGGAPRRLDGLLKLLAALMVDRTSLTEQIYGPSSKSTTALQAALSPVHAANGAVFMSYARVDDQHESGHISQLRECLVSEFRFQTGENLFVFQDTEHIDVGERWKEVLESNLDQTTLLLVILTPSYLNSETCRAELKRFLDREKQLERDDLVLPLYYTTVPARPNDALLESLLARQYLDWRELRFEPIDAPRTRRAVAGLAGQVSAAIARTATAKPAGTGDEGTESEAGVPSGGGLLEQLSGMELAMPRFNRNLYELAEELRGLAQETTQATTEIREREARAGGGVATARLIVARKLAARLEPIASRMESVSVDLLRDLALVNSGIRALANGICESNEEGIEEIAENLLRSVRELNEAATEHDDNVNEAIASFDSGARISQVLRRPLGKVSKSLRATLKCAPIFRQWKALIEDALRVRAQI